MSWGPVKWTKTRCPEFCLVCLPVCVKNNIATLKEVGGHVMWLMWLIGIVNVTVNYLLLTVRLLLKQDNQELNPWTPNLFQNETFGPPPSDMARCFNEGTCSLVVGKWIIIFTFPLGWQAREWSARAPCCVNILRWWSGGHESES